MSKKVFKKIFDSFQDEDNSPVHQTSFPVQLIENIQFDEKYVCPLVDSQQRTNVNKNIIVIEVYDKENLYDYPVPMDLWIENIKTKKKYRLNYSGLNKLLKDIKYNFLNIIEKLDVEQIIEIATFVDKYLDGSRYYSSIIFCEKTDQLYFKKKLKKIPKDVFLKTHPLKIENENGRVMVKYYSIDENLIRKQVESKDFIRLKYKEVEVTAVDVKCIKSEVIWSSNLQ